MEIPNGHYITGRLDTRGRITISEPIRNHYKINPGDLVTVQILRADPAISLAVKMKNKR